MPSRSSSPSCGSGAIPPARSAPMPRAAREAGPAADPGAACRAPDHVGPRAGARQPAAVRWTALSGHRIRRLPLPRAIADGHLAQARAEAPLEACGLIPGSASGGRRGAAPLRPVPQRARVARPLHHPPRGPAPGHRRRPTTPARPIWGIVHSHVRSPAVPSPTDVELAYYPDALYLLVSLADEPALRAWRIADGSAARSSWSSHDRGPRSRTARLAPRRRAALVGGTLLGWSGDLLEAIANPPALVRAALVGRERRRRPVVRRRGRAAARGRPPRPADGHERPRSRCSSAASGTSSWRSPRCPRRPGGSSGHPLPFVVALVIAGVDILETTFLLFVIAAPQGDG